MSYEAVVEKVKDAPEACLDEISQIIDDVVYRYNNDAESAEKKSKGLSEFFGAMQIDGDPLEIQKEMRADETPQKKTLQDIRGSLAKYANPKLMEKEAGAWIEAVKEKYDLR